MQMYGKFHFRLNSAVINFWVGTIMTSEEILMATCKNPVCFGLETRKV